MATPRATKKKSAKKTFPSAKKVTVPRLLTVEALAAVMAESHAKTEAAIDRLSESHAKTEAAIERLSESHAKTEAAIERLSIENEKTLTAVKESSVRSEKAIAEIRAITSRMEDNFGGVSKRLGRIVELIIAPKIRYDINTVGGHNFSHIETDTLIRGIVNGRKEDITEVDVLLRGPTEVMAVELKTRLRENHVRDHVDRLQDLRDHEEEAEIKGKKLLGAVGGVVIDESAKRIAKQYGLYIVGIREEKEAIDIEKPETCRTW